MNFIWIWFWIRNPGWRSLSLCVTIKYLGVGTDNIKRNIIDKVGIKLLLMFSPSTNAEPCVEVKSLDSFKNDCDWLWTRLVDRGKHWRVSPKRHSLVAARIRVRCWSSARWVHWDSSQILDPCTYEDWLLIIVIAMSRNRFERAI